MNKIESINPSNYKLLGSVKCSTLNEVKSIVNSAHIAQKNWQSIGLKSRINILKKVFQEFIDRKRELLLLQSKEIGMTLQLAEADFEGTMGYVRWFFDNAEQHLSPKVVHESDKEIHELICEPLGVSAIIIPWNFPFANFVWASLQSLIAGNTIVLKHSEECPLNGKFIEKVFSNHMPIGVFNEIYGDGKIGELLIRQNINMISFTGSVKTGKHIYEIAGKRFIKTVMELGGSAPGIIFDDADLDKDLKSISGLRLLNSGQMCDGLKRLIVHEKIFDKVVKRLSEIFKAKKIGQADKKSTEIGPLASKKQLNILIDQIADAKIKKAEIITGGNSLEIEMGGAFFEPTILTNITQDMRVWNEEVFGPVLPIVAFKTEQEAINLANKSIYGLGSYIFTKDQKKAQRVAKLLETGMISVNSVSYKIPSNPFGGYKSSGIGRIHGEYGFHEVTQNKIIARNK